MTHSSGRLTPTSVVVRGMNVRQPTINFLERFWLQHVSALHYVGLVLVVVGALRPFVS